MKKWNQKFNARLIIAIDMKFEWVFSVSSVKQEADEKDFGIHTNSTRFKK